MEASLAARCALSNSSYSLFCDRTRNSYRPISRHAKFSTRYVRRGLKPVRAVAEEKVKEEIQKLAEEASKTFHKIKDEATQALDTHLPKEEDLQKLQEKTQEAAAAVKQQADLIAEQLKAQADRASSQLVEVVHYVEEHKEEIVAVAKDAPEPVREIVTTAVASHSREAIRQGAVIHDFCLGIPYGALLVAGGIAWFTLAGSLNALRFGLILGGLILANSISSLRAWQSQRSTLPYIVFQAALSSLVFVYEATRFAQTKNVFPTGLAALVSLVMVAFYTYIVMSGGSKPKVTAAAAAAAAE
eukprot:TRINITY_DN19921_c3_g1_i2.p1 TRINITY_DN19921_c3_g1~~TRINITY_DN19921_c3_g1_i2.p1  ORF type:complete len:301 (-),score=43.61 TRINITY_DN19921_c3_g1_i2:111-1013(-)